MNKAIEMKDVSKWFGDFKVLNKINLEIKQGEKVVVCGPSGSGKSTLVRCINRLEVHQAGVIKVIGNKLSNDKKTNYEINSKIGMVFQQFNLFPHLSVLDNLTLGPTKVLGLSKNDATKKAMKL